MKLVIPVLIEVPEGATHYAGHFLDTETPFSVTYYRVSEGQWLYWSQEALGWKVTFGRLDPHYLKPIPFPEPPMAVEVCIHGNVITNHYNSLGTPACPEGCISNIQRSRENRQLAAMVDKMQFNEMLAKRHLNSQEDPVKILGMLRVVFNLP